MNTALILAAFSAGFLGSPHCLGMCGGVVAAFNMSMPANKRISLTAMYHVGRLLSYALLGMVFGLLGAGLLSHIGNTPYPRLLLGLMFILLGLTMLGIAGFSVLEKAGARLWHLLGPVRKRLFPINTPVRALLGGLVWGLLPCGLVYTSLALALTSGNVWDAGVAMLAFGLGTLPMLIGSQQILTPLQAWLGKWRIRSVMGGLWLVLGVWTMAMPLMHLTGMHQHSAGMAHGHDPASMDMTDMDSMTPEQHQAMMAQMAGMDGDEDEAGGETPVPPSSTTPAHSHQHHNHQH